MKSKTVFLIIGFILGVASTIYLNYKFNGDVYVTNQDIELDNGTVLVKGTELYEAFWMPEVGSTLTLYVNEVKRSSFDSRENETGLVKAYKQVNK